MAKKSKKTPLINKYGSIVLAMIKAQPQYRKKLVKEAPDQVIHCISECCQNLLKGNVPLSIAHKRRLYPKRTQLRVIASKSIPVSKKKKILNQTGGILPFLFPLIPLLGKAIVGGAISAGVGAGVRAIAKK